MAQQDVYQVDAIFNHPLADGEMATIFHYRLSSVSTPLSEQEFGDELAVAFLGTLATDYLGSLSIDFTLVRADWFNVSNPVFGGTIPEGTAGGVMQEAISLRSAPVVKKITGLRGRSFRGRNFLMAPVELEQAAGVITVAHQTVIGTLMDNLQTISLNVLPNIYNMTVFSPTLTLAAGGVVVDNLVSGFQVQRTMGSVRGRQAVS